MAHISLSTFWGPAAGIYLVSIQQEGDWAWGFTPARKYFSAYITTMDHLYDSVQHVLLGLSE